MEMRNASMLRGTFAPDSDKTYERPNGVPREDVIHISH